MIPSQCYVRNWYNPTDLAPTKSNLKSLRAILDNLDVHGKPLGNNVKPSKCQLIEKKNLRESAVKSFEGANITMVDGFRVLGSVIGTPSACDKFMESEIERTATLNGNIANITTKCLLLLHKRSSK